MVSGIMEAQHVLSLVFNQTLTAMVSKTIKTQTILGITISLDIKTTNGIKTD